MKGARSFHNESMSEKSLTLSQYGAILQAA